VRPVPQQLLVEAAAHRTHSHVASAGGLPAASSGAAPVPAALVCAEMNASAGQATVDQAGVAGAALQQAAVAGQRQQEACQEAAVATVSVRQHTVQPVGHVPATPSNQQSETADAGEVVEAPAAVQGAQQAGSAGAALTVADGPVEQAQLLSPAVQRPALAAAATANSDVPDSSAVKGAVVERQLLEVPTPCGVMSQERLMEVRAHKPACLPCEAAWHLALPLPRLSLALALPSDSLNRPQPRIPWLRAEFLACQLRAGLLRGGCGTRSPRRPLPPATTLPSEMQSLLRCWR
jgi:hypothetical protein